MFESVKFVLANSGRQSLWVINLHGISTPQSRVKLQLSSLHFYLHLQSQLNFNFKMCFSICCFFFFLHLLFCLVLQLNRSKPDQVSRFKTPSRKDSEMPSAPPWKSWFHKEDCKSLKKQTILQDCRQKQEGNSTQKICENLKLSWEFKELWQWLMKTLDLLVQKTLMDNVRACAMLWNREMKERQQRRQKKKMTWCTRIVSKKELKVKEKKSKQDRWDQTSHSCAASGALALLMA